MTKTKVEQIRSKIKYNKHYRDERTKELKVLREANQKGSPQYKRGIRIRADYNRKLTNLRNQLKTEKKRLRRIARSPGY